MTTVLNGLLGGLVAGGLATCVAAVLGDGPSLAATLLAATRCEGDPEDYRRSGPALQVVAGSIGGGALVALELYALGLLAVPLPLWTALAVGIAWGVVLLAGSVALVSILDPLDRPFAGRFRALAVGHLAYGVLLGLWIRLTWIT